MWRPSWKVTKPLHQSEIICDLEVIETTWCIGIKVSNLAFRQRLGYFSKWPPQPSKRLLLTCSRSQLRDYKVCKGSHGTVGWHKIPFRHRDCSVPLYRMHKCDKAPLAQRPLDHLNKYFKGKSFKESISKQNHSTMCEIVLKLLWFLHTNSFSTKSHYNLMAKNRACDCNPTSGQYYLGPSPSLLSVEIKVPSLSEIRNYWERGCDIWQIFLGVVGGLCLTLTHQL
jgi:hypothetical protein